MCSARLARLLLALLVLAAGCNSKPAEPAPAAADPLTIFAASSLTEVATEIATEWSKRSGTPHRLQFEASSTLARQIQEGAPVDVFITAAPEWLDNLKTVDRYDWLSNQLVLVVSKDAKDVDATSLDSLALANEQVPVGKYAREALSHLKIKIPDRVIYGQNVRDVLSKVSQGGATAGVVYATDVPIDPNVRIALTFPAESHSKILYSAGLLTPDGRQFFAALREPWALDVARKHGFVDVK